MTDEQRENLRQKICEELKTVAEDIVRLEEVTQPISPENAIGRVSRMDAIGNKMINEQALATARNRKEKLETALNNANTPDFGLCISCMSPIPIARFLAIPEANLCIRCASQ